MLYNDLARNFHCLGRTKILDCIGQSNQQSEKMHNKLSCLKLWPHFSSCSHFTLVSFLHERDSIACSSSLPRFKPLCYLITHHLNQPIMLILAGLRRSNIFFFVKLYLILCLVGKGFQMKKGSLTKISLSSRANIESNHNRTNPNKLM